MPSPKKIRRRSSHPGLPRARAGPKSNLYLKPIKPTVERSSSDDNEEEGEDLMKCVMREIDALGYKTDLIFVKPSGYKYVIG